MTNQTYNANQGRQEKWKAGTIALLTAPGFQGVPPESVRPPTQFFFGKWNHISSHEISFLVNTHSGTHRVKYNFPHK